VQGRAVMVRAVIAVVKQKPIQERAGEIARMVVGMVFIAAIVLKIISTHNAPSRIVMRDDHKQHRTFPVQENEKHFHSQYQYHFSQILPKPSGVLRSHFVCETKFRFQDFARHGGEKQQLIQDIQLVAHLAGADGIFRFLGVFVMAEIMPRHVGRGRVPVGKRKHNLHHAVQEARFENGFVDGVVNDDRTREGKETIRHHEQNNLGGGERIPVNPRENGHHEIKPYKNKGAYIGFVMKHGIKIEKRAKVCSFLCGMVA